MATKRKVSKTSKTATINFNWDNNNNKKKSKKTNKQLKKLSVGAIMVAIVCLIVGAVGGFFAIKIITQNDCFTLIGKDEITLRIGEDFVDKGARVIAFGKDDTNKVLVETNLTKKSDGVYTASEEGTYYVVYTVDNFKYGKLFKVQKIRLVNYVEETELEEIESANQGGNT